MQYKVACANRETGAEFIVLINASSEREALNIAVKQGHMVVSAVPFEPPPQAPAFDDGRIVRQLERLIDVQEKALKKSMRIGDHAIAVFFGILIWAMLFGGFAVYIVTEMKRR